MFSDNRSVARCATAVCLLAAVSSLIAQPIHSVRGHVPEEVKNAAVPLPPMGWGSWNSFANNIDAQIAMRQAEALVSTGLRDAGYKYMLLDEGWWRGERDESGNIVVDPQQWPALKPGEKPGDMANIVRYIHGLGLKAGTYTDAGPNGCSTYYPNTGPKRPFTGSEGHYDQDFLQFAKWGFDYVKVDWCGGFREHLDPAIQYAEIARAIRRAEAMTGHRMFFSICDWGNQSPWTWAPGIGGLLYDMWRTGGDITNPIVDDPAHAGDTVSLDNVFKNFDAGVHPEAQHTGYYNDLDMMVLGMRGMSESADQVHMSLWAISGAPMIVGADIARLSKADVAILTNKEAIEVHQDPLGLQAIKVSEVAPGLEVWAKPMAGPGRRAVLLLNRTGQPASITVQWAALGLAPSADVTDVWAHKDLGPSPSSYAATVPALDAVLLLVKGEDAGGHVYRSASQAVGGELGAAETALDNETLTAFRDITSPMPATFADVVYRNSSGAPLVAQMRVDGNDATNVSFPPTPGDEAEKVSVEIHVQSRNGGSVVEFRVPSGEHLDVQGLSVAGW